MHFWPRSLIARILIVELGAIAVAAVALPLSLEQFLHHEADRYQFRTLGGQAQAIAQGVSTGAAGLRVRLDPNLASAYASPYDGRAYVVSDQAGRYLAGSAFAGLVPWGPAPRQGHIATFRTGAFIGVSLPLTRDSMRLWVIVSQNQGVPGAILDDVVRAFVRRYDPLLVAILLLLPLINSRLIGRLVLAVRATSQQAKAIGPHDLDVRLEEHGLPMEVAPLAHATNALVSRLQTSFRQQAEFVANVAHELRTPLAAHRVELDRIADAAVRQRLIRSADRLAHVVSQLHDLATLEVIDEQRFGPIDIGALARETVSDHAPQILAAGRGLALDLPDGTVMVHGNPTLAMLALANLLTNANRHTPPGTHIQVRVTQAGAIEVRDDGPGIAAATPEEATRRYWRADHQRSDGAGLGLSIVRRIMDVHDGAVEIESTRGAGACFRLRFRPAGA